MLLDIRLLSIRTIAAVLTSGSALFLRYFLSRPMNALPLPIRALLHDVFTLFLMANKGSVSSGPAKLGSLTSVLLSTTRLGRWLRRLTCHQVRTKQQTRRRRSQSEGPKKNCDLRWHSRWGTRCMETSQASGLRLWLRENLWDECWLWRWLIPTSTQQQREQAPTVAMT